MSDPRLVLVTGAAGGLGLGIAEAFAQQGDRVILADRDPAVQGPAERLSGIGWVVDISDPAAVTAGVAALVRDHGVPDVLVNNAGVVGAGGPLLELDLTVLDAAYAVNVRGTVAMTQAVGRAMARAGRGAIVNISSVGARQPTVGLGHYEATKAAVDAITRTTALELAPSGVRANAVAPGPVHTPLTADLVADPAARAAWESRIPLGAIAVVEQVAPAVLFLAGPTASHITGASLQVDGGQLLA